MPSPSPSPQSPLSLLNAALAAPAAARDFFRKLAAEVVAGAVAHARAKADAAAAAALLLQDLVADLAPVLPYMATKVALSGELAFRGEKLSPANMDEVRTFLEREGREVRAVHAAGDGKPVRLTPQGSGSGTFTGRGVWLTERGDFFELRFEGSWSTNPDRRQWRAAVHPLTVAEVPSAWRLEEIVETLATLLAKQHREEATAAVEHRRQVLEAVRTLLSAARPPPSR